MHSNNPLDVARRLIERHGLRAGAIAQEHASEAQLGGEPAQLDTWRSVQAAVAELKRTERRANAQTVSG